MKMRNIVSLILVMGILASVLSGCHGSRALEPFAMPDELDMSREYEITFWAKNDTNIQQTRIYKKAIEDFQALYPNIRVNLRLYTDYGKIYNDVITNIATGTTPNVCITYPDHIATYRTGKNIVEYLLCILVIPQNISCYSLTVSAESFLARAQGSLVTFKIQLYDHLVVHTLLLSESADSLMAPHTIRRNIFGFLTG